MKKLAILIFLISSAFAQVQIGKNVQIGGNTSSGSGCTTDCVVTDPPGTQSITQLSGTSFVVTAAPSTFTDPGIQFRAQSDPVAGTVGEMQFFAGDLEIGANLFQDYYETNSNFTFSDANFEDISFLTVDSSVNAVTVTLPVTHRTTPTIGDGHTVTISRLDSTASNGVTIVPPTGGSIQGSSSLSLANGQSVTLYSGVLTPPTGSVTTAPYWLIIANTGSSGSGLSGMTAGQVPIAATATTVTSSKALAGAGPGITTGPNSGVTAGDLALFTGTAGQITDGAIAGSAVVTLTGTQTLTNKTLTSPTMTTPTLGAATATSLTSGSLTDSGLTSGQCVQAGTGGLLATTGAACGSGGGTGFPITLGSTSISGSSTTTTLAGLTLTSPTFTTPALGTPSSGVITNLTGTGAVNITGSWDGVTCSGTPTTGQVPTATAGTTCTWQTPSGGGSLSSFSTVGGSSVTNSNFTIPTVAISGAPSTGYGLTVAAPSGATTNYAASFSGGNVGVGITTPTAPFEVQSAAASGAVVLVNGTSVADLLDLKSSGTTELSVSFNGAVTATSYSATQGVTASAAISSSSTTTGTNIRAGESVITFSTTPVFVITAQSNIITLTGSLTSWTLAAGEAGQSMTLTFCQNATGSFTTGTTPANVRGFFTIGTTASKCNSQSFTYSANQTAWLANSPGVLNF